MEFEKKPLKSAVENAMEKNEELKPVKSAEAGDDIEKERTERIAAEIAVEIEDIKKIRAVGVEKGLDVSSAIAKKEEKVAGLGGMMKDVQLTRDEMAVKNGVSVKEFGSGQGGKQEVMPGKEDKFDIADWHRKEVVVKRSSGETEGGWIVTGDTGRGVAVSKVVGDNEFLNKVIKYEDFFSSNKKTEKLENGNKDEQSVSKEKGIEMAKIMKEAREEFGLSGKEVLPMSRKEIAKFILTKKIEAANTEADLKKIFMPELGKLDLMKELKDGDNNYSNEKIYNAINSAFRNPSRETIIGVTSSAELRPKIRKMLGM